MSIYKAARELLRLKGIKLRMREQRASPEEVRDYGMHKEAAWVDLRDAVEQPIPMVLYCPGAWCGVQHIDVPKGAWLNPPHRTHTCQACGFNWRPADVPTTGVQAITTKGQTDGSYTPLMRSET